MTDLTPPATEPVQLPRAQVLRNRWKLIGILLVFVLPVFFAYAGYFGGWFKDYARSNRGELLNPFPQIAHWQWQQAEGQPFATEGKWWLVYVQPTAACDANCELALYTLRQTWIGIGKENDRVRTAVVGAGEGTMPEHTVRLQANPAATPADMLAAPVFYVIDPMGNVVLRYQAPSQQADAIERSKDIRKDFAKLLRFSHIG